MNVAEEFYVKALDKGQSGLLQIPSDKLAQELNLYLPLQGRQTRVAIGFYLWKWRTSFADGKLEIPGLPDQMAKRKSKYNIPTS
jgi:hypothetical protein